MFHSYVHPSNVIFFGGKSGVAIAHHGLYRIRPCVIVNYSYYIFRYVFVILIHLRIIITTAHTFRYQNGC